MKSTRFLSLATVSLFLLNALAEGSLAQNSKPPKGPAYVSPPSADENYPLMGEFVGVVNEGKEKTKLAIQIRPIAENRFVALAYSGGLPGQPGHESSEMNLIGLRSGDSLILSGGPWAIFVDPDGCTLISKQGKRIGRLKRVARVSPTLGAKPPEGAIVLFDGANTDNLIGAQVTVNGLLKQGVKVLPMLHDFNLHLEFRLPYMPLAEGQSRGNSGVYLQSRYECQILDSFGTERLFNGLGALYRQKAPDVNMAFPPLRWQTYDIQFTAARWGANGNRIREAHLTSWVNGVKVQDDVALPTKTGAGKIEEPTLTATHFQDHGDPVRFQNVWVIDRGLMHADFPVMASKQEQLAAESVGWEDTPPAEKVQTGDDPAKEPEPKTPSKSDGADSESETADRKTPTDEPLAKMAPKASSTRDDSTATDSVGQNGAEDSSKTGPEPTSQDGSKGQSND